uniref:Uncharacterized protein n=1 Tax=Cyclophora tenuis TaxID=216820 RepID=A0A7S1D5W1_CYCTE
MEDEDDLTKEKIVSFDAALSSGESPLFEADYAREMQQEAKSLILRLLARQRRDRPGLMEVANDSFFGGTNVFALYQGDAPSLGVGTVAPVADAKWARRQFSSIWAPQPKSYDISMVSANEDQRSPSGSVGRTPIAEGAEGPIFFSFTSSPTAVLQALQEYETK